MFFKKSTKRAVKQFTKARAELQAVVEINHDKVHYSYCKDDKDTSYINSLCEALRRWLDGRRAKSIVKRSAYTAELQEARAWLDALPKIKKP
tara:strand:- start:1540 stop:1815 length:276 start_codon:yes stop_codon:yes gene_type:complete